MIKLFLPTGSLGDPVFQLMTDAGLRIRRENSRANFGSSSDPRIDSVRFLRSQHIPRSVERDARALGICGEDSIAESGREVEVVARLPLSKNTAGPVRVVLFGAKENPSRSIVDVPEGSSISTEYPNLTETAFRKVGKKVEIEFSYGSTEADVPNEFDFGVTVVETGSSLIANGLKIVSVLMESSTVLVCNRGATEHPELMRQIQEISILLEGVLSARSKVLLLLNVATTDLETVLAVLDAMRKPTVSHLSDPEYRAVSSVVSRSELPVLIPMLLNAGAQDLVEVPIAKAIKGYEKIAGMS